MKITVKCPICGYEDTIKIPWYLKRTVNWIDVRCLGCHNVFWMQYIRKIKKLKQGEVK